MDTAGTKTLSEKITHKNPEVDVKSFKFIYRTAGICRTTGFFPKNSLKQVKK